MTYTTSRHIKDSPENVYAAIADPERLARWWGPAGFTNEVERCEFVPNGRWVFVMVSAEGARYPNENRFLETGPERVVIEHVSEPRFVLTITLAPAAGGTDVGWSQAFENEETARRIEAIVVPANEQNLDRLTVEVERSAV